MKLVYKIWPIVLFAIGLFFLFNSDKIELFDASSEDTPKAGQLEVFNIDIPAESSKNLDEQLKTFPKIKKEYVQAQINGHDIKLKFHGTANAHFYGKQKSYRIKISKEDDYSIDNKKKLQLIKYGEADPALICANLYAKEMGLIAPVGRMVDLQINGLNYGVYYLVEHHDDAFFKRHGFDDIVLLSQTTIWSRKEVYQRNHQHSTPFDWNIEHLEQKDHPKFTEAMLAYQKLGEFINADNITGVKSLIDIDYMSKFLSCAALFNEIHFLTGDNMKWMYDFNSKKLFPYYRQESGGKKLQDDQKHNFADFDSHLFKHSLARYGVAENLKIFKILLADDSFRNRRNHFLHEELTNDRFKHISDSIFQYKNFPILQAHKAIEVEIYNRMKRLGLKYLNYGHIYGTYSKQTNQLSLFADALCPIEVHDKHGNLLQTLQPIKMDNTLKYETIRYEFNLDEWPKIKYSELVFKNTVTNKTISQYDVSINHID